MAEMPLGVNNELIMFYLGALRCGFLVYLADEEYHHSYIYPPHNLQIKVVFY